MLPKNRRIERKLFAYLLEHGRSFHSPFFSARIAPFPPPSSPFSAFIHGPQSRFAFVVSKKTAKTAVLRNKLRRRGYAAVRSVLLSVKPGLLIAFFVKKEAINLNFQEYKEEITKVIHSTTC